MSGIPSFNQRGPQRLSLTTIRNVEGRTMQDLCLVNFEAFRQPLDIDREADAWQLTKALCWNVFAALEEAHHESKLREDRKDFPDIADLAGQMAPRAHALGLTTVITSLIALDAYIASCYLMTTALESYRAPVEGAKKGKEPTREEMEEKMVEDAAKVEELVEKFGEERVRAEAWMLAFFDEKRESEFFV